jgi:hypothetical protein
MGNLKRICLIDDDSDDCFFFEEALQELNLAVDFLYVKGSAP